MSQNVKNIVLKCHSLSFKIPLLLAPTIGKSNTGLNIYVQSTMKTVLITGANGYIGKKLIQHLHDEGEYKLVAVDLNSPPQEQMLSEVNYEIADIRDALLKDLFREYSPQVVVHLASIVSAGGDPDFEYSVDVLGTENVLESCLIGGTGQIIVTSSGAAYGYHADSPEWLSESDPLRGNDDFPYSKHKRLVEELLAKYRLTQPQLKQLIFRPGAVIGPSVSNQITALFEKPFVLGVAGFKSSFVFIWDEDVVSCFSKGIREGSEGIFNLAGTGALSMKEIAGILNKPYLPLPAWLIGAALGLSRFVGLGKLGPEHVKFLRYRPVLSNHKLVEDFGLKPQKTSKEAFEAYRKSRLENVS